MTAPDFDRLVEAARARPAPEAPGRPAQRPGRRPRTSRLKVKCATRGCTAELTIEGRMPRSGGPPPMALVDALIRDSGWRGSACPVHAGPSA